ncbi:MAG: hypothetical protein WCQ53_06445 [bacterium]
MKKIFYFLFLVLVASCSGPSNDLTSFSINNVAATINGISITVTLPVGTNVTSLSPIIEISEGATVSPASGVAQDFSKPVIYTVTGANKEAKDFVVMVITGAAPVVSNLCTSSTHPTTTFESGSGVATDPYIICTPTQLNLIGALNEDPNYDYPLLNKYYKLGTNLDMSSTPYNPIGNITSTLKGFTGSFDGNGKTISGLNIGSTGSFIAFIPYLAPGGLVRDLGLSITVTGSSYYTAGLVAYGVSGTILNSYVIGTIQGQSETGGLMGHGTYMNITGCYSTANVTGSSSVGGLIGSTDSPSFVTNSYATGAVVGSGDHVGGLIGSSQSVVLSCMATGNISGVSYVGGLIGQVRSGTFASDTTNSYATGSVTASGNLTGGLVGELGADSNIFSSYSTGPVLNTGGGYTGGLVGNNDGYSIIDSYSTSSVNSSGDFIGGFVGQHSANAHFIQNCYSIGSVTGSSVSLGGFIGLDLSQGNCSRCYWNTETSGQGSSACGDGKTTEEMTAQPTEMYDGWDFDYAWSFDKSKCSSYPSTPSPYLYPCLRIYSLGLD